jgi:hypothetical protein
MFSSDARTVVTLALVVELGITGWVLGHGLAWLLAATVAVTAVDSSWGLLRRRYLADVTGLELALALALLMGVRGNATLSLLLGLACLSWLIRPQRQPQATPAA